MAVKKKAAATPRAKTKENPKGAGRRGFLGPNPRILPVPMRDEDRKLITAVAEAQGEDDVRLVRRAIYKELERLGHKMSGVY